jgi:hypothetical protein
MMPAASSIGRACCSANCWRYHAQHRDARRPKANEERQQEARTDRLAQRQRDGRAPP